MYMNMISNKIVAERGGSALRSMRCGMVWNRLWKGFALAVMMSVWGSAQAQVPLTVVNGGFEQWSTYQGYSASVLFLQLPIYDGYSCPTGWNHLSYGVNETVSYSGISVNINTQIPLLKVSQESLGVPQGNKALRLQSFMLSDLVTATAYSLAQPMLDSHLVNTVFPTVLTTGSVDMELFMPYMDYMIGGMSNIRQMIALFDTINFGTLVQGGIDLGGMAPHRLTGLYKYHSAEGGDNGAVAVIGTRYNAATQRREVVGAGCNMSLTDTDSYTPFQVDYIPRHLLQPSYPEVVADTVVVLLVSSANNGSRQQGSYLVVDDLQLWHDTCYSVGEIIATDIATDRAEIAWTPNGTPDGYEIEYGTEGFPQGTGRVLIVDSPTAVLTDLQAGSIYDCYVRALCGMAAYGEWRHTTFRTAAPPCDEVEELQATVMTGEAATMVAVQWHTTTAASSWHLSLVEATAEWDSTVYTTVADSLYLINVDTIQPYVAYAVYVRTNCGNGNTSTWQRTEFVYIPQSGIGTNEATAVRLYPNPAHGECTVEVADASEAQLRLYSIDGRPLQSLKTTSTTTFTLPWRGIFVVEITTPQGKAYHKILNR